MATIQIDVPDAQVQRVLDAFAAVEGWTTASGITKAQNARRAVARHVKDVVAFHEARLAAEAAALATAPPPPPDVT